MKSEKSLSDLFGPEAETKSDSRAEADVRAGRVVEHERVRQWLNSVGSADPLPRPRSGD